LQERRDSRGRFLALALVVTLGAVSPRTRAVAAAGAVSPPGAAPTATATPATTPADAERPLSFARDVASLLDRWCVSCHGARQQNGGLRLDSYLGLMRGGDEGPAVIPGDPSGSLLVAKIERHDRPAMPPRRRLPAALVARLRAWIAVGASP
jgi:mono/diheme cytochrome c family protein